MILYAFHLHEMVEDRGETLLILGVLEAETPAVEVPRSSVTWNPTREQVLALDCSICLRAFDGQHQPEEPVSHFL